MADFREYIVKLRSLPENWEEIKRVLMEENVDLCEVFYFPTDDSTNDSGFPLPWDAWVTVEGENIVFTGAAGCSGFGEAVTKCPKCSADVFVDYHVQIQEAFHSGMPVETAYEMFENAMNNHGVEYYEDE